MAGAAAEVALAMARAEATVDTYRKGWQTQVKAAFFPSAAEMLLPGPPAPGEGSRRTAV